MHRPIETYRGESMFRNNLLLFVNRATENFSSLLHNHDFLELSYVAEGEGFHYFQDEVRKVHKGQLIYIPIGTPHVYRPTSSDQTKHPLIVYNCVFHPLILSIFAGFAADPDVVQFIGQLQSGEATPFYIEAGDPIEKLFLALHQEYSLPQSGSTDYFYVLFFQLLILVHRALLGHPQSSETSSQPFTLLLHYIELHFHEELTLSHMARISRWSERHLQRRFMEHTEQSFRRYVQSVRIRKSCELLRDSQLKVSAIAEKVGYKDIDSFVAVFKRNTGQTPTQYRKSGPHTR